MISYENLNLIIRNDLIRVMKNETIYHFSSFNIAINEIISKQTLLFSNPKIFNDPFDCNEKLLQIDIETEDLNNQLKTLTIRNRKERRELLKKINIKKEQNNALEIEKKKLKIACFSEKFDETLMWSHYADKHQGICIGFNFPYKYDNHFILCPVKYIDKIKKLEGTSDTSKVILYWLTTKSERWKYENEIRAITKAKTNEDRELVNYDSKYIKEIIFGCNVKTEKIKSAIKTLKANKIDIRKIVFKKMYIDENTFLLKDKEIKI